jgi:hypothetical protein
MEFKKPKMLRSFWPNLRLKQGPSSTAVTGCKGQQLFRRAESPGAIPGRRSAMERATASENAPIPSCRTGTA